MTIDPTAEPSSNEQSGAGLSLGFGVAGLVIGVLFPPVASLFVKEWVEGRFAWFFVACIGAGEMMAFVAAVSVRSTVIRRLENQQRAEREKRRGLQEALHTYIAFAEKIAQGDLVVRLGSTPDRYEDPEVARLGRQLDAMVENLHALSKQVAGATEQTSNASAQLLTASAQQTTAAAEQAAAVSEITTTVEEVRQTAEQAAERAKAVIGATEQSKRSYDEGLAAVGATVDGITNLKDRVDGIAKNILGLSEKVQQIGEIVATVSELAEQSNLLAINAAIEAAKAGEQGRGFAVVAGEVRSLAEQSKQATRQVRGIIAEIQRATNTAVMVTEEGTKQAEAGLKVAQQTGTTLQQMAQIIEESVQSARQIAALSRQQSLGVDQVSVAMKNIEQTMRSGVDATRSTELAARDLTALATQMKQLVARHTV